MPDLLSGSQISFIQDNDNPNRLKSQYKIDTIYVHYIDIFQSKKNESGALISETRYYRCLSSSFILSMGGAATR